jgi:hypothetical protein
MDKCPPREHKWKILPKYPQIEDRYSWCMKCGILRRSTPAPTTNRTNNDYIHHEGIK